MAEPQYGNDKVTIEEIGLEAKKIYVDLTAKYNDSRTVASILLSACGIHLVNAPNERLFWQYQLVMMESIMRIEWRDPETT